MYGLNFMINLENFPKFFHPDPTVKRKSDLILLLKAHPMEILFSLPYYKVI